MYSGPDQDFITGLKGCQTRKVFVISLESSQVKLGGFGLVHFPGFSLLLVRIGETGERVHFVMRGSVSRVKGRKGITKSV